MRAFRSSLVVLQKIQARVVLGGGVSLSCVALVIVRGNGVGGVCGWSVFARQG